MGIIQQKLVWFLGTVSIMVILMRLQLAHTVASKQAISKLKFGVGLIIMGTVIGICSRLILGGNQTKLMIFFYLENLLGYLLGWCLIIWGLVEWARGYFDLSGRPKRSSRLKLFSERLASSMIKEQNAEAILSETAKYLLLAINCQVLTLHKPARNSRLALAYQFGMGDLTEPCLLNPADGTLISITHKKNLAQSTKDVGELGKSGPLITSKGPIRSACGVPLGDALGVLTVYSIYEREYSREDLDIINLLVRAMSSPLKKEKAEQNHLNDIKYREILVQLSKAFDKNDAIDSSILRAARILHAAMPFSEMNLYISGNGPVVKFDFSIQPDASLNIYKGHFRRGEYPHLFAAIPNSQKGHVLGSHLNYERSSLIAHFDERPSATFWLEIAMGNLDSVSSLFSPAAEIISQNLGRKIANDKLLESAKIAEQRIGALKYIEEKVLASASLSDVLQEVTRVVVDTGQAAFCTIALLDPLRKSVMTAGQSQARNIDWKDLLSGLVKISRGSLSKPLIFHFDRSRSKENEFSKYFPKGIRCGGFFPIFAGSQVVGYLIAGDFRGRERDALSFDSTNFISGLALMVSIVMTWHKEKRIATETKEGHRRLTMVQKARKSPEESRLFSRMRSRINGPLAGILASCEYLEACHPELESDVERFLGVIQKNARRIHELASEKVAR